MRANPTSERGFTLLEVTVSSALFLALLGGAALALVIDTQTHRVLTAQVGPEIAARSALERITTELRMAGVRGEDRNGNGVLEESEDLNENGVMDSDWNLSDGSTQDNIKFNRRIEVRYSKDDMVAQGEYTRAVTFRLIEDRLVRFASDTIDGETRQTRVVLARRISRLQFTRTKSVIHVELDVQLPKGVYKDTKRTLKMNVRLRN